MKKLLYSIAAISVPAMLSTTIVFGNSVIKPKFQEVKSLHSQTEAVCQNLSLESREVCMENAGLFLKDSDQDGVVNLLDQCPLTLPQSLVDASGCAHASNEPSKAAVEKIMEMGYQKGYSEGYSIGQLIGEDSGKADCVEDPSWCMHATETEVQSGKTLLATQPQPTELTL